MPCDYYIYPANWKTEIVPRILKRAGHRCEICTVLNYQLVYSVQIRGRAFWLRTLRHARKINGEPKILRVVLTVAHLDHDNDNPNVQDNRLLAMCQYCHLTYDREEHIKRKVAK